MTLRQMLLNQWLSYSTVHQSPVNLWLHLFAVPVFWVGLSGLLFATLTFELWLWLSGVALLLFSLVVQSSGHKSEGQAPAPFTSVGNAVTRILLEQLITFPRFVLTGGWWQAMNKNQ